MINNDSVRANVSAIFLEFNLSVIVFEYDITYLRGNDKLDHRT